MDRKEHFLELFNKAFSEGNTDFILSSVTDDISWNLVGEIEVSGKEALSRTLEKMKEMPLPEIIIDEMILHKNKAVVTGAITGEDNTGEKKKYGFCDVYCFARNELKIEELISYVVEITE